MNWIILSIVLSLLSVATYAQDEIVFTPQWTAQAQFTGYYVAEAKGFYREAGVKVRIEHPSVTQPAMARLRSGECQATTLQVCQALEIVDAGIPLVNILQTSMNNAMVIVSARDKDPLSQKGARVGIWSVGFGQLAIEEAVVNVMEYAYPEGTKGTVNLVATIAEGLLSFVISDSGKPFDPTAKAEVDTTLSAEERPIGGLGIHLVRQIMDDITYERRDNKNILTLRKKLNK